MVDLTQRRAARLQKRRRNRVAILTIFLCLITAVSVTVTVILLLREPADTRPADTPDIYPAVSADTGAEKIEAEVSQPPLSNPEGGGAVSLAYSREVTARQGDGIADIMFQNPAKSNQSIVLQLHLTDRELLEKIGKTGRMAEEKAKIETASGYAPETYRMLIAQSGLLVPGYKLSKIKLNALPDGTVLPAGKYNAVYYILSYDEKTNERAIVNMQIPVVLTVNE